MKRWLVVAALILGIGVVTTEAQGRFWVLVNGALRYTGLITVFGTSTVTQNGLATTSTDATILNNTTPSTAGVPVQMSPRMKWCGTAYNSVSTLSETNCFFMENLPATVAGTTTATYKIGYIAPGGAVTYPFTFSSIGSLTTTGNISVGSTGTNGIVFGAHGLLYDGSSDGRLVYANSGNTSGIGLDVTTDSLLKIRTRAQNGDASISVLAFGGAGTGTTVANVGANSCGTTAATIAGNQVSGVITVGATAGTQCRVTFTTAASVARDCTVTDSTTTVATRATVVDVSNTDFLGAFVAGDKITYQCTVR